jgi:hypothetical protein
MKRCLDINGFMFIITTEKKALDFIYLWLYFAGPWPLFSFLILYTVGMTPWDGGSARRKAAT